MTSNPKNDGSATATIELEQPVEHHLDNRDEIKGRDARNAALDRAVRVKVSPLSNAISTAQSEGDIASPEEGFGTATSTPPGDEDAQKKRGRPKKVVSDEPTYPTDPKVVMGRMLKARTAIMGKSKALTISRYEMAGYIALLYVLTKGDTTEIRQLLADAGEKWPEGNSKSPLARALVQYFMFPDEDCCSLQSRISEWARVVTVLRAQNVATPDAAREFLEANGGVRGVYANFDQEGHLKPQKVAKEGDEDDGEEQDEDEDAKPDAVEYRNALAGIATTEPMAKFQASRPFDIIRDGLALALVRPVEGNPKEVEVIDCLSMDGPAFQRAVIKFARLRHHAGRLTGTE